MLKLIRRTLFTTKNRRYYHINVIDHYENPRNVGSMNKDDKDVGTGIVGSPACGDMVKLQVRVKDDIIVDAKFKAFGCGSAIASTSLLTEWMIGKSISEVLEITNSSIANELRLPPVKLHCSMLAEDVKNESLMDFKRKNPDS